MINIYINNFDLLLIILKDCSIIFEESITLSETDVFTLYRLLLVVMCLCIVEHNKLFVEQQFITICIIVM